MHFGRERHHYLKVISVTEEEEEEDDENTATNTNEHPKILEGGSSVLEMVVSHNFINPLNINDESKRVQNNALFMQEAPEPPVPRL